MTPEHFLTEREQLILQAVVHMYITTAEAVGSRAIVKRYGLDLSPATVRNAMADLEEAGFLQQLHTSSGRVPTDRGYRYYVDFLMRAQELTPAEQDRIEQEFASRREDADEALRLASQLLALISRQTGLVEAPPDDEAEVLRIEVVPIGNARVGVMVADSYGRVRAITATMPQTLNESVVAQLNQFLNEELHRVAIAQLAQAVRARLESFYDERRLLAERALQLLEQVPAPRPAQVFLEGATQLFDQPEFQDISKAQSVFTLLEERNRLAELLRAQMLVASQPRVIIMIGSEAGVQALNEVGVVAAPYRIGDRPGGLLGVLGPRRMPYSRLTAIVEYTADILGRHLTRLAG